PDSVGRVLPGVDLAVFGADGSRVPAGETGRLFILSEGAFEGYTGEDSAEEIDGYLSIGDAGRIDEDGYVYVEGRADDMVVVGGENVYPIEVEETVMRVEGVREVAVTGLPDEEFGQVLAAFVVGDATEEAVLEACRSSLASYKVPRRVELLDELPRTATGKVLTRELVARFEKE
ncbi:MAG: class I adenylate-forming enzyme family protein, partial [Actinomycetota bacterium]